MFRALVITTRIPSPPVYRRLFVIKIHSLPVCLELFLQLIYALLVYALYKYALFASMFGAFPERNICTLNICTLNVCTLCQYVWSIPETNLCTPRIHMVLDNPTQRTCQKHAVRVIQGSPDLCAQINTHTHQCVSPNVYRFLRGRELNKLIVP